LPLAETVNLEVVIWTYSPVTDLPVAETVKLRVIIWTYSAVID
jgi:hypothetical protein